MSNLILKENVDKKKVNKIFSYLGNNNIGKKTVLNYFLKECNYDELETVYLKAPVIYKGLLSFSFLRRKDYEKISFNGIHYRGNTVEYVERAVFILTKHADLINSYLKSKQLIDRNTLLGNYKEARQGLKNVEKDLCYSCWSVMYDIKLERLINGLNSCIKLHNDFFFKNQSLIGWFLNGAFKMSSLDFANPAQYLITPELSNQEQVYNNLMITYCFPLLDVKEGEWMNYDFNSSIIDLYNNLMVYLPNLDVEILHNKRFLRSVNILCESISDPQLHRLACMWKNEVYMDDNAERVSIVNNYLKGDYSAVCNISINYMECYPEDFDVLCLYLKSLVQLGEKIPVYDKEGCIIEKIRYLLASVFFHIGNFTNNIRTLRSICHSQNHLDGIKHLYSIVTSLDKRDLHYQNKDIWKYCKYKNISDTSFFENTEDRKRYLNNLPIDEDFVERIFNETPHEMTPDYIEVSVGFQDNEYIYNSICGFIETCSVPSYLQDAAVAYVFSELMRRCQFTDAVVFYVRQRIKNYSIDFVITECQQKDIQSHSNKISHMAPLELAVFYQMINADVDTIYFAYKDYLRHEGIMKASEITTVDSDILKYFLGNVATMRVLTRHVLRFNKVEEVMNERMMICSNLFNIFAEKVYADEESNIARDKKIRELNVHVDESKIYVDTQSIKENELSEARALFETYNTASKQSQLAKTGGLAEILEKLREMEIEVDIIVDGVSKKQETINYKQDILQKIFKTVREQFLFNPKSGLDNYLSTRIRHGTLINKLRNSFERSYLVTNTVNGAYVNNEYWIKKNSQLLESKADQCFERFAQFSEKIDGVIARIKDEFIQVQTEEVTEKNDGCFDYRMDFFKKDLISLLDRTDITDSDGCIDEILDILWKHTEHCLESMKERLSMSQADMLTELNDLEKYIANIIGIGNPNWKDFNDAVIQCQNAFQNDVQTVTRWFKLNSYIDFNFTMDQVVRSSIQFIEGNSRKPICTNLVCTCNGEIKGMYFGALYDMFHDLLNNAQNNENQTSVGGVCDIEIREENEYMFITVSNPLIPEAEEKANAEVQKMKDNLHALMREGRSRGENKSGCTKIFNAVHYHLGSQDNTYENNVEDHRFKAEIKINLKPIKV